MNCKMALSDLRRGRNIFKNMTLELLEFSEEQVLNELKDLMLNERIAPEPEYQFFCKYLAAPKRIFTENEEAILHLINLHGVHLRNDVKYWLDKSKVDSNEDSKRQIPVLDPNHFLVNDYNDVIYKLQELPSEWTVVLVTKKFSLHDVIRKQDKDIVPEVHITRLTCGTLVKSVSPYSVTTDGNNVCQENIFKTLHSLSEMRHEYYRLGRTSKKLYEAYYKTNSELESFLKELELYFLGPWVCLLQGRIADLELEKETYAQVQKLVLNFCTKEEFQFMPNEQQMDAVYQLTISANFLKNKSMFNALRDILYAGVENLANVSELMLLVEDIKMLNLSNSCAVKRAQRHPVILVLDNELEGVPWEMVSTLSGQPVCRNSSLQLLYALYKYHEPFIKNGYRLMEIDSMYCLINPSKDLESCEKEMKEFLGKRIPWAEKEIGKAPDPKDLLSKIEQYSAYLYCGHGSGIQYLKVKDLKRAFMKGLILLFGCASNIPRNCGGRTPHQNNTYTYIINGCPCVVGCIQDLGSTEADAACKEVLSYIMPEISIEDTRTVVKNPKEPNILKAVAMGRGVCGRFWSKSAFAVRGIPCMTVAGDIKTIFAVKVK